jgi:iron complex outermembrane recepter protein
MGAAHGPEPGGGAGWSTEDADEASMKYIESKIGIAMASLLAMGEAGGDEATVTLPEIVVTATSTDVGYQAYDAAVAKIDIPIFHLPISIQVVPREVLDDQQVIRLEDALKNVSGVYQAFNNGFGETDFGLRGFRQLVVYEDGFRVPGPGSQETAHLERVEVLKGPASALYGRIEPGGLIHQVTKRPRATASYALRQQFGSFELYRTTLDATGPLTKDDTLRYRLNIAHENANSFRDFVDREGLFVSPVVTWNIGARTQASVDYQYRFRENPSDQGIPIVNGRPAPVPISRYYEEPGISAVETESHRAGFMWSHAFDERWVLHHRFKADRERVHGQRIEPGRVIDGRTLTRTARDRMQERETYFTTLDLTGEFTTGALKHRVLTGLDYYNAQTVLRGGAIVPYANIDLFEPVYSGVRPVFPALPESTRRQDWFGLYFQDHIDLLENLHVLGGGRYDWAGSEQSESAAGPAGSAEDRAFSPRVGLVYQPTWWLGLYGSYTESFGASAQFGRSRTGEVFGPETATQYEAGLKADLLDGSVTATLAFYHLTKQGVLTPDPVDPDFSVQTGEARSRGIELDVSGEPTLSLKLIASLAYTDTEITKSNLGDQGNPLAAVPEWSGSLWAVHTRQEGPLRGLRVGAGIFAEDARPGDNAGTFELPGYVRVDLLAGYEWTVGSTRLTAQINVENAFDQEYFRSPIFISAVPGAPRTFLGSIRLEF